MGNKPPHPQHIREFIDGPLRNNKYRGKQWDDQNLDLVIKKLDKDISTVKHLVPCLGLEVDLRGNNFSKVAIGQILGSLYEHGLEAGKLHIKF